MTRTLEQLKRRTSLHIPRIWRWRSETLGRDVAPAPSESPRIVILSASIGSGHTRAAQAIKSALERMLPNATIAHVDVLQMTNGMFRRAYGGGYFRAVQQAPHFVGMMYDLLDKPGGGSGAGGWARQALERFNFSRLKRFLVDNSWDLAINTHFLPPALIGCLRRSGRLSLPQATVVTDFDVHGLWVNSPCERYFVATDEARANLISHGIDPATVQNSGIPIDPLFSEEIDFEDVRRKHGLATDRPMLLQLAGGFGIGRVEQIFRAIGDLHVPLQLVVVAGKNESVRRKLESIQLPLRHRVKVIGFTSEMHELMAVADLVVSKPGGLTTSECLARGCAMAVVDPIPGQEDRNADFLLENGCAIKINNLGSLAHKLQSLLSESRRLNRMRLAAARCGRPNSAAAVASRCIEMLRSRTTVG